MSQASGTAPWALVTAGREGIQVFLMPGARFTVRQVPGVSTGGGEG
jgi:hypothetical protein